VPFWILFVSACDVIAGIASRCDLLAGNAVINYMPTCVFDFVESAHACEFVEEFERGGWLEERIGRGSQCRFCGIQ
jgi:hypothetical protein